MFLDRMLQQQGHGTRRDCRALVAHGRVALRGVVVTDPDHALPPAELGDLTYSVNGTLWLYAQNAYLMMHKPAGVECSHKPGFHPSIYALLPQPLLNRDVQTLGRLDHDTTGLLLLSDDGKFIHKLISPKHHVPKVYEVTCKHAVTQAACDQLQSGVVLDDDPAPVRAAACEQSGEFTLRLTLTQGKYHQVKRMIAAVSNRCEGLHRSRIGELALPADLAPGQWRWLSADELRAVGF